MTIKSLFLSDPLSPIASIEWAGSRTNFLSCCHLRQFICSNSFPLKLFWTETAISSLQFIHWGSHFGRVSDWCQDGSGHEIFLRTFSSSHLSVGSTLRNLDCVAFPKLFFPPWAAVRICNLSLEAFWWDGARDVIKCLRLLYVLL